MRECWNLPPRGLGYLDDGPPEVSDRQAPACDLNLLGDSHSFCFEGAGEDGDRPEGEACGSNVVPFRRRAPAARPGAEDRP